MNKEIIIKILESHQEQFRQMGVLRLALFGSAARDELRENSDIDLLVAFQDSPTFDAYLKLKRYLENILHRKIDLVTEMGLKPRARILVQKDLIRVA
jgi:uncharacterized protein